jgi:hypothetical protein
MHAKGTYLASSQSSIAFPRAQRQFTSGRVQRRKPSREPHQSPRHKRPVLNVGEAAAWETVHKNGGASQINREDAYGQDCACTAKAKCSCYCLRRSKIGPDHVAGTLLFCDAQEASWCEDNRRVSNGYQVRRIPCLATSVCHWWTSPMIANSMQKNGPHLSTERMRAILARQVEMTQCYDFGR